MLAKEKEPPLWLGVYHYQSKWSAKKKKWVEGVWKEEEVLMMAPFNEDFHAFTKGGDYYFVTASGKAYVARKPAKGETRKIELLWGSRRQQIVALITDADAQKTYLFCKATKKDDEKVEDVYFELSAKPSPRSYDLSTVQPVKAEEPLKSVLEYARILVADKKVKAK
jgi:hypothetical protein